MRLFLSTQTAPTSLHTQPNLHTSEEVNVQYKLQLYIIFVSHILGIVINASYKLPIIGLHFYKERAIAKEHPLKFELAPLGRALPEPSQLQTSPKCDSKVNFYNIQRKSTTCTYYLKSIQFSVPIIDSDSYDGLSRAGKRCKNCTKIILRELYMDQLLSNGQIIYCLSWAIF